MLWGWDSSVHINIHLHNGEFSSEPLTTSIQWKLKAHWDLLRQSFTWELVRIITMLVKKKKKQLSRKINGLKRIFMPNFFLGCTLTWRKEAMHQIFPYKLFIQLQRASSHFFPKALAHPAQSSEQTILYQTGSSWPTLSHISSPKRFLLSLFSPFFKSFEDKK